MAVLGYCWATMKQKQSMDIFVNYKDNYYTITTMANNSMWFYLRANQSCHDLFLLKQIWRRLWKIWTSINTRLSEFKELKWMKIFLEPRAERSEKYLHLTNISGKMRSICNYCLLLNYEEVKNSKKFSAVTEAFLPKVTRNSSFYIC